MPDSMAASELPPMAYIARPEYIRVNISAARPNNPSMISSGSGRYRPRSEPRKADHIRGGQRRALRHHQGESSGHAEQGQGGNKGWQHAVADQRTVDQTRDYTDCQAEQQGD